jgi:23S rRNA (cytidine1920-2'-O)/16S rRNA (cytidine1409-2'-O)-methyltransferase
MVRIAVHLQTMPNENPNDKKSPKQRLDELLVSAGHCDSRTQAKALILAGKVWLDTHRVDKPGRMLPSDSQLRIEKPPRFVSRGGEKLAGFIAHFNCQFTGTHVLDVGASTGGFTDCCLQNGAASVTCVDVGRAQLHAKLCTDPRVTNIEKCNARHLQRNDLPRSGYDWVVMDLSFISLRLVLPAVWPFVVAGGGLIALVKPQFEATRAEVNAGKGIIRDPLIRERILHTIQTFALEQLPGAKLIGHIPSPISGTDGNEEWLLGFKKSF